MSLFLDLAARPQDKGGGAVRPIVLSELLVKLALGAAADAHMEHVKKLVTEQPEELSEVQWRRSRGRARRTVWH